MKYLKLYESFDEVEIDAICKEYNIRNYTINPDGSIDVNQIVRIWNKNFYKLPLQFNKVNGVFDCSGNNLKSLEGAPKELNNWFNCASNKLTSFQYSPKIIRNGGFDCENNDIRTFEYFPSYIGDVFFCIGNPIYYVWRLFKDWTKIELLNDYDMFRDENTDLPCVVMDRLNDFLLEIGEEPVEKVYDYKNI